jgi:hypothetical protein
MPKNLSNQIKVYLPHAPNTTGVDLTVKCLLTGNKTTVKRQAKYSSVATNRHRLPRLIEVVCTCRYG